ncbi:MAG: 4-(cytidine 5'-diphospho)-2-C-methyl-D-erythritol kinase [Ignavibacteriales bacterium]|nr:4-(cytidine 5'-diphospho)-2-C-methyl-D-erythritol kinase [Ignavibacteriales bacterium]
MNYVEIKAPAKINFGLFVTSKRSDGFHNIETIFYPINDLYDELFFTKADRFEFISNDKELENKHNLIIKAKEILETEAKKIFNVKIELNKKIPIGAGLGGGSSDAAATLLSLNEMFKLNFELETLRKFALELGSDVPFFIKPKPSFAEGRGEKLSVIDFEISSAILLVNPGIHISTKEAYGNIHSKLAGFNLGKINKSQISDPGFLIKNVKNDFEDYVFNFYPEVENIKEILYQSRANFSIMTGSGSTVFGLFNNLQDAMLAKEKFPSHYFTFISYSED